MKKKGIKRNIFHQIFGIPATKTPQDPDCWNYLDGVVVVDLKKAPELKKDGGAIRLEGGGLPARTLVYKGDDGQYRAVKNRCTHIGHRRLDPVPGENCVQCCSVLGSSFEYEGKKISGPARHPVQPYQVEQENDTLKIILTALF